MKLAVQKNHLGGKILHRRHNQFLTKIFIFDQDFYFWPKFFIFDQNFNSWPKFRHNHIPQFTILIRKSNDTNVEENKLSEMKRSARIVDPFLHWREPSPAADYLLENSDFLVVGVIGQQGVGKSSLMSLLGGSTWRDKVILV